MSDKELNKLNEVKKGIEFLKTCNVSDNLIITYIEEMMDNEENSVDLNNELYDLTLEYEED